MEAEYITAQLNPQTKRNSIQFADQFSATFGKTEVLDPGIPARLSASSIECLVDKFQRYETSIENKLYRTINQLERFQRIRRGDHVPAPIAIEIGGHIDKPLASFGNLAPHPKEETP